DAVTPSKHWCSPPAQKDGLGTGLWPRPEDSRMQGFTAKARMGRQKFSPGHRSLPSARAIAKGFGPVDSRMRSTPSGGQDGIFEDGCHKRSQRPACTPSSYLHLQFVQRNQCTGIQQVSTSWGAQARTLRVEPLAPL